MSLRSMSINIDLSNSEHPKFSEPRITLSQVNFFYGRNGTGKTTLTSILDDNLSQQGYLVRIFSGFDPMLANDEPLNALSLGEENAEAQRIINSCNKELEEYDKQITEMEEKYEATKLRYDQNEENIRKYLSATARKVKETSNPQIARPSYNITDVNYELQFAQPLDPQQSNELIKQCREIPFENIIHHEPSFLNSLDISELFIIANQLLQNSLKPQVNSVPGIDTDLKRSFAQQGMNAHMEDKDEICAFCGNALTEERWELLRQYFDESFNQQEHNIEQFLQEIRKSRQDIDTTSTLPYEHYYSPLHQEVTAINGLIAEYRNQINAQLSMLEKAVEEKRRKPFSSMDSIPPSTSNELKNIIDRVQKLNENNQQYHSDIVKNQNEAREKLRYANLYNAINEPEYKNLEIQKLQYETEKKIAKKELDQIQAKRQVVQTRKDTAIEQTVNEHKAADFINNALKAIGTDAFQLEHVEGQEGQKGQYRIVSDGEERPITTLSTGEKNLLSFLYFLQSLEESRQSSEKLAVIFDDPMNSNDSTAQYLIYNCLTAFYHDQDPLLRGNDIFVMLTHNIHFYMNAKPYTWKAGNKKILCFEINKTKNISYINPAISKEHVVKTEYDLLWHEFNFAYKHNEPSLMWNPLRRIITSYEQFSQNCLSKNSSRSTELILPSMLKKALDVNSHEISDVLIEASNYTCDEILDFARQYFRVAGAEEHFKHHCNIVEQDETNGVSQ